MKVGVCYPLVLYSSSFECIKLFNDSASIAELTILPFIVCRIFDGSQLTSESAGHLVVRKRCERCVHLHRHEGSDGEQLQRVTAQTGAKVRPGKGGGR